ncbi:MAG TPA: sigma factor-like helix-turn-helix DNA-binding protein, partial [Egibacteraceae bacterium]|nr:sigma factor-like helix-turn-helix DNA-binding protein [Egibacteraceae bacterium]
DGPTSLSGDAETGAPTEFGDLVAAVRALSAGDQRVIGCRYFLELSERETAAVLGVPAGTVKSRLSRALRRLRAELETSEPLAPAKGDVT